MRSEYWGETGRSAYHRFKKHQEEVVKRDDGNAFAKHLASHHPEAQGDITKVMSSYKKPLPRKKTEALKIQTSEADFLLNSKNEFKQPAQYRVVRTRENDDPQLPGGRGRGAGGGRRPGGGGGARRRRGGQ